MSWIGRIMCIRFCSNDQLTKQEINFVLLWLNVIFFILHCSFVFTSTAWSGPELTASSPYHLPKLLETHLAHFALFISKNSIANAVNYAPKMEWFSSEYDVILQCCLDVGELERHRVQLIPLIVNSANDTIYLLYSSLSSWP